MSASLVLFDVHGDTARNVLNFVHNKTNADRVIFISSAINTMAQTSDTYTACINPLEVPLHDKTVEGVSIYASEIAEALEEILQSSGQNFSSLTVQMTALLKPVIFTVMYSCKEPSLLEIARFFQDKNNVNADLIQMGKQSPIAIYRTFFEQDWGNPLYTQTKSSLRTKILFLLSDPALSNLIIGRSTVSMQNALTQGKVVIVSLPKSHGKFCSSVFSRLLIAYIQSIMQRRANIEDFKKRKSCYLFLDEFQNMITKSLSDSLAESRKWGLNVQLATQSIRNIEPHLRKQVLVNTAVKFCSLADYEDKQMFAKEFDVPIENFNALKPLEFLCRKFDGKHKAFKFRVPIMGRRFYMSKSERADFLQRIVYHSGVYRKVENTPPPPPQKNREQHTENREPKEQTTNQPKNNIMKSDPFDDDYTKRFTTK